MEAPVIGVETHVLLRHLLEQGMSKTAIAEQLGIHRRTIARWMHSGELDRDLDRESQYGPRPPTPSKLDPYKPIIRERLEAYRTWYWASLPKRGFSW